MPLGKEEALFLLSGQLGGPRDSAAQSYFWVPDAQERPGSHLSTARQCHKRTFSPPTTHNSQPHCTTLANQCAPVFDIPLTFALRPHPGAGPQPSDLPHPDHSLPVAPPSPTGVTVRSSREGGHDGGSSARVLGGLGVVAPLGHQSTRAHHPAFLSKGHFSSVIGTLRP